jgi:hypothetical protein
MKDFYRGKESDRDEWEAGEEAPGQESKEHGT